MPIALVGAHVVCYCVFQALGVFPPPSSTLIPTAYALLLMKLAGFWLPVLAAIEIGGAGLRKGLQQFRAKYLNLVSLAGVPIAALVLAQSAITHDAWKSLLGQGNPWTWDARLALADRYLHLGHDPWRLLHPLFSSSELTHALDTVYWLWYLVIGLVAAWVFWTPNRSLRARFLIAWTLVWIVLGSLVAHMFPSGGPAFYGMLVEGPNPYADLIMHLKLVDAADPLLALSMQELVWRNVQAGGGGHWITMSAMPSLHVATPVLFTFLFWQVNRKVGIVVASIAMLTFLGSIYLGWHYAVDGYASAIGVSGIWWLSGRGEYAKQKAYAGPVIALRR